MTPDDFRRLALALPGAEEGEHHGHPDFRVGGKIFATIGPDATWGMVKVAPEDQEKLLAAHPEACDPSPGAWGRQGCTTVRFEEASAAWVGDALDAAWSHVSGR